MSLERMVCGVNYTTELIKSNINNIIGSLEKGFATVRFAELVEDPTSRASVDAAVTALNAMLKDDDVVDLSGTYVWPTVNFTTGTKNNIKYKNGTFKRLDDIGVEYLFWLNGEDSSVSYCNFDGGSTVIPTWGQQCIYIPESINAKVHANTFKNIGDGAVRFARKAPQIDEPTKNVIISNNIFKFCGQVTTNDTGADRVILTGNIFDNSAIKITQSQSLTGYGQTVISSNVFIQEDPDGLLISFQGCENVLFEGNHIMAYDIRAIFNLYPNTDFKVGEVERIPLKRVSIRNNSIYASNVRSILYIEGKENEDLSANLNNDSFIDVSNNNVWSTVPDGMPVRTRFLVSYVQDQANSTPSSLCRNLIVKDNNIHGDVTRFVFLFEHGMNPKDKVLIQDNFCENATEGFVYASVNGLNGTSGDIVIKGNEAKTPAVILNSPFNLHKRINSVSLKDNNFHLTNEAVVSDAVKSLELDFEHIAKQYKISSNTFEVESDDITGDLISVIPPDTAVDSVGTQLWMINNTLIKSNVNTSLAEMSSFDIKATVTDGTIEQLYCNNNKYGGALTAPVSNEVSVNIADINLTSF